MKCYYCGEWINNLTPHKCVTTSQSGGTVEYQTEVSKLRLENASLQKELSRLKTENKSLKFYASVSREQAFKLSHLRAEIREASSYIGIYVSMVDGEDCDEEKDWLLRNKEKK